MGQQQEAPLGILDDQLSFLSPQDQQRFQQLFQNATNDISISPEAARNILLKSQLSPHHLARIWELSDINKTGDLLFPEFALALHLCNVVLRGEELPYQLDHQIRDEVSRYVDKINFSIPEGSTQAASNHQLKPSTTNDILETQPVSSEILNHPGLQSQPTGYGFQNPVDAGFDPGQLFQGQPSEQQPYATVQQQQQQPGSTFLNYQPTGAHQFSQPSQTNSQAAQFNQHLSSNQQTGYVHQQLSQLTQPADFSSQPFNSQPTSFVQKPLNTQVTGFSSSTQPLQPSQTQAKPQEPAALPLTSQITGYNYQQPRLSTQPLNTQSTGFHEQSQPSQPHPQPQSQPRPSQALNQQNTGYQAQPLNNQTTGYQSQINPQATGLVPLNREATGGQPLTQQPTGLVPLNGQSTGANTLMQQPTGLIPIPTGGKIQTQQTGGLQQQPTGLIPLPRQTTGAASEPVLLKPGHTGGAPLQNPPVNLAPLRSVSTSGAPLQSQRTGIGQFEPLRAQKTGVGQNSFFLTNLVQQQAQPPSIAQQQWTNSLAYTQESITPQEKQLFNKIFENYDTQKKGLLNADVSAEIFRKSGLNREDLEKVWDLVTRPNQSHLDKESFQTGMWLVYKRLNGWELPERLPESLIPSSLKILDDVKNRLKTGTNVKAVKKSSNSRMDGSRFKNNDDELMTSSARHRRRQNPEPKSYETGEKVTIDELKKKIWEKKILLEALQADEERINQDSKVGEIADLQKIEELKRQIQDLPSASFLNNSEKTQLKAKFNNLTSKVPVLILQISQAENKITQLKLELFKTKNPSSIIGTGPNGEITEGDIRKAKAKALLAAKMSKLTGKPVDSSVADATLEQDKLTKEIFKIREESQTNQKKISAVEESIRDISDNIIANLKDSNSEDYKKWELGIGVQPEVQEIIKTFRVNDLSNKFTKDLTFGASSPSLATTTPSFSKLVPVASQSPITSPQILSPAAQSTQNGSRASSTSSIASPRPTFQSTEERKAFIKEQARKKMEERMAKFGIRKSSSSSSPAPSSPKPSSSVVDQSLAPTSASVPVKAPEAIKQPSQAQVEDSDPSDSSDDDEAEFQRMEEIRRLKRQERDARLTQLGNKTEPIQQESTTTEFHDSNPFAKK